MPWLTIDIGMLKADEMSLKNLVRLSDLYELMRARKAAHPIQGVGFKVRWGPQFACDEVVGHLWY
jgi:hypothetical protein